MRTVTRPSEQRLPRQLGTDDAGRKAWVGTSGHGLHAWWFGGGESQLQLCAVQGGGTASSGSVPSSFFGLAVSATAEETFQYTNPTLCRRTAVFGNIGVDSCAMVCDDACSDYGYTGCWRVGLDGVEPIMATENAFGITEDSGIG
jgi:hypothetical protein